MERGCEAVNLRVPGGGHWFRPPAIFLLWVWFVCPLLNPSALSQTSDFLIVQNTGRLVVYDSFQQSIPASQGFAIPPFAPMRIVARRDLLGDGLTPCMKVEVDGEVFYLLRDDAGKLAGGKDLGIVATYQRRLPIGDTIEVIQPDRLTLYTFGRNARHRLAARDRLVRYFEDDGNTYVKRLAPLPSYGWMVLPERSAGVSWRIFRSRARQSGLSPMIRGRVASRIAQINTTLFRVYAVLGKETGKDLPVPAWSIDSSGTGLACIIHPASSVRFYPRTVDALATELQAYVVGTGYRVTAVENRIEIIRQ